MKRIFCMLLCGLILAGCGQSEKALSYYPHDDTLRLDASANEVFAAQEMKLHDKLGESGIHVSVKPVKVNGLECIFTCAVGGDDKNTYSYSIESIQSDLIKEHKKWKEYASNLYGSPKEYEGFSQDGKGWATNWFEEYEWEFEIDTGKKYLAVLTRSETVQDDKTTYEVRFFINEWRKRYTSNEILN